MLKKKNKIKIAIISFLFIGVTFFLVSLQNNNVEALSRYGSRGEEVKQIQTKLKRWGYYNGNIDGICSNYSIEIRDTTSPSTVVPSAA